MTLEKFLKSKAMKNVHITENQKRQIQKMIDFFEKDKDKTLKRESVRVIMVRMLNYGVDNLFLRRIIKGIKCGRGQSLKNHFLCMSRILNNLNECRGKQ